MTVDRRQWLQMSASGVAAAALENAIGPTGEARAAATSELSGYDATGLAELVRSKQVSALEVVEDTIRKIEAINPSLNAVINKPYDQARLRAKGLGGDGALAGVPLIVKDNATIAGATITRGTRALRGNVVEKTAPFFAALENAGMILVGIGNMPEMGLIDGTENVLYGPTKNPWHLDYSPGGSSGGSAVAVAAGMLPLAHGTDGGGSIRIPASQCGLFGLKASRGRTLPGNFAVAPWVVLVDCGVSRSVRDSALFLGVVEDPATKLPKVGSVTGKSPKRLKIGLMLEGMKGQTPHPDVKDAIMGSAKLCGELGHTVEEVKLPLDQARLMDAFLVIWAIGSASQVEAFSKLKGITKLEDAFEPWTLGLREEALRQGPFDRQIASVIPVFEAATAALDRFFSEWDVLLSPVLRDPVFKTGARDSGRIPFADLKQQVFDYVSYTPIHNICGTTAMSVPLAFDRSGLPIGSQFAARAGAEATLLSLAYELEEARPWASKRPPNFVT
jgi:amidase